MSAPARSSKPRPVSVTAWALWDASGVTFEAAPGPPSVERTELAPWSDAPELRRVHPRARRPDRISRSLIQLAHGLFERRARRGVAPDLSKGDVLLGTAAGSSVADAEFLAGLRERGAAFGSPSTFVYTLASAAPAELALALGMRGALSALSAGSASGLTAVVRGAARVAAGESELCLCGGFELGLDARGQSAHTAGVPEQIALFLLEPEPGARGSPTIEKYELGFGFNKSRSPDVSLRILASALASLSGSSGASSGVSAAVSNENGNDPREILSASPEGCWAQISLR